MRYFLIAATVAWGGLMAASSVQAMPISGLPANVSRTSVIQVDYACGRGWHENEDGECRPNWRGGPPRRDWDGGPPPRHHHHHWDDGDDNGWHHQPRW